MRPGTSSRTGPRPTAPVLRDAVPKTALHTPIPGSKLRFGTVADLAREIVGISEAGLVRRALTNDAGEDETIYLEPLEKILTVDAKTPAEDLLDALRRRMGQGRQPGLRAQPALGPA